MRLKDLEKELLQEKRKVKNLRAQLRTNHTAETRDLRSEISKMKSLLLTQTSPVRDRSTRQPAKSPSKNGAPAPHTSNETEFLHNKI